MLSPLPDAAPSVLLRRMAAVSTMPERNASIRLTHHCVSMISPVLTENGEAG